MHALIAGNDVLLCAQDVPRAVKMIKKSINDGLLSENDINESAEKSLCKKWMGLDDYKPLNIDVISDSLITNNTNRVNQN